MCYAIIIPFLSRKYKLSKCIRGCFFQDGKLQPDPVRFPSGIPAMADYIHKLGMIGSYEELEFEKVVGEYLVSDLFISSGVKVRSA
jgi:hypothetical protein